MLLSLLLGSAVALVPQQRSSAPQQRFVAAPTRLAAVVDSYAISREIKSVFVHDGDYSLDVCDEVVKVGQMAIASKGSFSLAVPGGSIVKALSKLKTDALDFSKVHVFFCNERIDDNKCYQGALDAFTTKCGVPLANVHGVGSGSPTEVAASYAALIASHPSVDQSGTLPSFDMMLLGTGEDGHVGSLYPDSEEIRLTGQGKIVLAIEAGGEAPRRRMWGNRTVTGITTGATSQGLDGR
ncbi:glucosamine-6-phosphate isomerases/6-phosphogluconolactonase-domain-containing protein [Pelagophyceae sp. CCMP2097]|nr:glucosamine-6-phosphate isomerases/6-phosphogluconolactonase-domain-containing protein [Pelagophyceae sp. CCMP2097]